VTGGAGYIGSHFVKRLLQDKSTWCQITVLDSLTYAGNMANLNSCEVDPRFRFVHGDITNPVIVEEVTKSIDVIVNFAAESHVDRSIENSQSFISTNMLGTHILLENAIKNNVTKFVQISRDEVYGSIKEGSWKGDHILSPNSPYSASKASSDLIALSYFRTHGLNVIVTRCSNNYSPNQHSEKMSPFSITNLLQGKKVTIYGNGTNSRDWLHVTDHCRAIELVISSGEAGEIYNIGGGVELNNIELSKKILQLMDMDLAQITFITDRKGHDLRYSVDYSKIRERTKFQPIVEFDGGLASTMAWYRDNFEYWESQKV
jgi:dTDP-glucose 4,6-dehydratase